MDTVVGLLRATHPGPSLVVTALTATLAATAGRGAGGTAAVAAAVLAGQFSVGWGNDYCDRRRDAVAGRAGKPLVDGTLGAGTVLAAALVALLACTGLSLLSGWRAAAVHLTAVGAAWGYDLGLKATAASVVPYAVAFGLLPVFVTTGLEGAPLPPWWAVAGAALLGAGAHFANALPDLADDDRTGVRGLPQRAGHTRALALAVLLLGAGTVLVLTGPGLGPVTLAGLALGGTVTVGVGFAGRSGRERLAWSLTMLLAAVAVGALVASGAALV